LHTATIQLIVSIYFGSKVLTIRSFSSSWKNQQSEM
jgi:hypothetical protein